jgi:hypothetical protein
MEKANYKKQKLVQYQGNPMIEALPPIPEDNSEVFRNLTGLVNTISPEEKKLKPLLRMHLLHKTRNEFFFPFAQVRRLDTAIQIMIRGAYMGRNPVTMEYRRHLAELDRQDEQEKQSVDINERPMILPEMGAIIFGISGSGKSRALSQCLCYYPLSIRHEVYNGKPFTRTQLPWLMVEAPYDGNYVTFCRAVFQEIDKRCGTNNLDKYGYSTHSVSTMILHMQKLLMLYNVGILIIDEVQHLLITKSDSSEMLAFFVSLTNQLGVPIIYCGTSNAIKLFQSRMAIARRQTGAGDMKFQPIDRKNREWSSMMNFLWRGYVLREDVPLDSEMLDVFWECSQGLIGIVVALFCQVQIRALFGNRESFDVGLVLKTYNEDLALVKPMLEAIKSGNEWEIAKYEDLNLDIGVIIDDAIKEYEHQEQIDDLIAEKVKSVAQRHQSVVDSVYTTIRAIGLCREVEDLKLQQVIEKTVEDNPIDTVEGDLIQIIVTTFMQQKVSKSGRKRSLNSNSVGLVRLLEQSENEQMDFHDVLLEHGYIKLIKDDFADIVG